MGQSNGMASDFLDDIFNGLIDYRVDTLFIQNNATLMGYVDIDNKTVSVNPDYNHDIIRDAINLALTAKTKILILDEDEMPTKHKLAAIIRH